MTGVFSNPIAVSEGQLATDLALILGACSQYCSSDRVGYGFAQGPRIVQKLKTLLESEIPKENPDLVAICKAIEALELEPEKKPKTGRQKAFKNCIRAIERIFAVTLSQLEVTALAITAESSPAGSGATVSLTAAVASQNTELVRYLLENGEDPNTPNQLMITPLFLAATNGNLEILNLLLAHGAKVDAIASPRGETALALAVFNLIYPEVVERLLDAGANPHVLTCDGRNLLTCALQEGALGVVKVLLKKAPFLLQEENLGPLKQLANSSYASPEMRRQITKAEQDFNKVRSQVYLYSIAFGPIYSQPASHASVDSTSEGPAGAGSGAGAEPGSSWWG